MSLDPDLWPLQTSPDVEEEPVLLECVATHNYKGQYEDELTLAVGDRVQVTADSE